MLSIVDESQLPANSAKVIQRNAAMSITREYQESARVGTALCAT